MYRLMTWHQFATRGLYALSAVLITAGFVMGMDVYSSYQHMRKPSVFMEEKKRDPLHVDTIQRPQKKGDYTIIQRRNLFASDPFRLAKVKLSELHPPEHPNLSNSRASRISLKIRLVGTTVGTDGMHYAIFEKKGSREQGIYGLGDRVEGALIQIIERGEVYLLYHGDSKNLRMFVPVQENKSDSMWKQSSRSRPIPQNKSMYPSATSSRILYTSRLSNLSRTEDDISKQFRMVAFRDKNEEMGVRVFSSGKRELMRMLGFRQGDVVTKMGDYLIKSPSELVSALLMLPGQEEIEITVLRRGKKHKMNYRIK